MLQPTDTTAIPAMTHVVAHAPFPNGGLAIRLRDAFGPIFTDTREPPVLNRRCCTTS